MERLGLIRYSMNHGLSAEIAVDRFPGENHPWPAAK